MSTGRWRTPDRRVRSPRIVAPAVFVLAVASGAACYSADRIRELSLERAVDVEVEQDLLYECGLSELAAMGHEVASSSSARRIILTGWESEADRRRRLAVTVLLHPRLGPGVECSASAQRWAGEGAPDSEAPVIPLAGGDAQHGWVPVPAASDDAAWSAGVAARIRACWGRESAHGSGVGQ